MMPKNGVQLVMTRRGLVIHTPRPQPTLEAKLARLVRDNEELKRRVSESHVTFLKAARFAAMKPPCMAPDGKVEELCRARLEALQRRG